MVEPSCQWLNTSRQIVENRLSTDETRALTAKVAAGQSPEAAANEIVLRRETIKPERFAKRKRRVECPTCKGSGYVLLNREGDRN